MASRARAGRPCRLRGLGRTIALESCAIGASHGRSPIATAEIATRAMTGKRCAPFRFHRAGRLRRACPDCAGPATRAGGVPARPAATPPAPIQLAGRVEQGGLAFGTAPPSTVARRLGDEQVPSPPIADSLSPSIVMRRPLWSLPRGSTTGGCHHDADDRPARLGDRADRRAPRPGVASEKFRLRAPKSPRSRPHAQRPPRRGLAAAFRLAVGRADQRRVRVAAALRRQPRRLSSGLDIAGGAGAPVNAPADGVVILAATSLSRSKASC